MTAPAAAQYFAWRVATAVLSRLPLCVSYPIAGALGSATWYCWPRARRATMRNYALAYPGAARHRRLARRSLANYCCSLVDFMRLGSLPPAHVIAAAHGDSAFAQLDAALAGGRGAVIVCLHFGNWDLGAAATAARGYRATVVAETFADPRLDALVVGARRRLGLNVVPMERVGPSLVRALRKGGLAALLIDRPSPGRGVEVTFFGQRTTLPDGPVRLALRTGAAVIPVAFPRRRPGALDVNVLADFSIDARTTGDEAADIARITQAVMTAHESFVRRYPAQWYMFREMWPPNTSRGAAR